MFSNFSDPERLFTGFKESDILTRLGLLYEISTIARKTLELEHMLYIILTGVTAGIGLGYNRAAIYLLNEHKQTIEGIIGIGPSSTEEASHIWQSLEKENKSLLDLTQAYFQFKKDRSTYNYLVRKCRFSPYEKNLITQSFVSGLPITEHVRIDVEPFQKALDDVFSKENYVAIPLKNLKQVVGVLYADNKFSGKEIREDDVKILSMLADYLGLAVENSKKYEKSVLISHKDSLTGLWNHGYFQWLLSRELRWARKKKRCVSLIMVDIDNFKKINDSFGHQAGDIILKELAYLLLRNARRMDIICRYGGEEFSVILPNTSLEAAKFISERIRIHVEAYAFKILRNKPVRITVSLGLATYPVHSIHPNGLIEKADKALFIAKNKGKNNTEVAVFIKI